MKYFHRVDIITGLVLLLILLYVGVSFNIHRFYTSNNCYRHKKTDSLYAHFSMIDRYNYFVFPNLLFAHPIRYTLTAGQSLYIPKEWWHWVKTVKKTFAVNFWFNNNLKQEPFIFKHAINVDTTALNEEIVYVWNSGQTEIAFPQFFKDFYNSGLDNRYVMTLGNYDAGDKNENIKKKLANCVTFPNDARIQLKQPNMYDYNAWISSNKHDTGLHYDDEDGILTVISGEKEIILFPPSDSKYLYPYNNTYEWKNENNAENVRYNSFSFLGSVSGVSSGELLYATCNNDKRVLSNISKLYTGKEYSRLVWGFKKTNIDGTNYRWELYNYTLDNPSIRITSKDIYQNEYNIGDEEHYYYKLDDEPVTLPFWGYGKYKKNNTIYDESKIFVIDEYLWFYNNYDSYMTKLGYAEIKDRFRKIILHAYHCYEMCIFNKNSKQIFVMYLGISNYDFLNFLTQHAYPSYVIDFVKGHVENNNYNINNEIAIVYDIDTQLPVRSGFYGII
jgi:hypothetical protein